MIFFVVGYLAIIVLTAWPVWQGSATLSLSTRSFLVGAVITLITGLYLILGSVEMIEPPSLTETIKQFITEHPNHPSSLMLRAAAHEVAEEWQQAIALWEHYRSFFPEDSDAYQQATQKIKALQQQVRMNHPPDSVPVSEY